MQFTTTIANLLWSAANLPAHSRFRRALRDPRGAQEKKLRDYIKHNARTAFGQARGFDRIGNYEQFVKRVPLADYDSLEPWIIRLRGGETNLLSHDPVTQLVPTSGSSGARKLIPFTAGLQNEFNAAIGPWLVDLQRQWPRVIGGPSYWSVTPSLPDTAVEVSSVPIGFEADTAYLGGTRRRLAEAVMAVPAKVQHAGSLEAFQYQTLLHLLRQRNLRLISVWHPSFLTLLLDALPGQWEALLKDIARGCPAAPAPLPRRAKELLTKNPCEPAMLWPELRVLSCWGDGNAEAGVMNLQRRFPNAFMQRKGLLATEAVVTIPFAGAHVLAVESHFFEFLDSAGSISRAHELREGGEYEIVVTTGGGLWRYRLRDQVRVVGYHEETPALKFLGRAGIVSDLFGEKLSEMFVNQVIDDLLLEFSPPPPFILLAPDRGDSGFCYTLFVEGNASLETMSRLDLMLRRNPHYAWCRELGQLQPPLLFRIAAGGCQTFIAREMEQGSRIGDIKPRVFSPKTGWVHYFAGGYSDLRKHPASHSVS